VPGKGKKGNADDGFGERHGTGFAARLPQASLKDMLANPAGESVEPAGPRRTYQHGHRARLRQRFLGAGPDSVADYEMLELVLFRAIPQRDVKPIAKRLIEYFGDFNGVISAPRTRLGDVPGIGPAVICELKIVEAAAHRLARARVMNRHALSSWSALMDYCKATMAHRDTEQFRILFLDRKNVLIADEAQAKGTVDHVPVYPREVAGAQCLGADPGAQPPLRRPDAVEGRHRHDPADRAGRQGGRRDRA